MSDWQVQTPVALFIFRRPGTTEKVFEAIRRTKPQKLLIVADGPRSGHPGEPEKCAAARAMTEQVDWPCEVLRSYSDVNLGCKWRMSSGLDWVFQAVEEAIILEDDCLPYPSFFRFCEELLEWYRSDERVMHISGDNFQFRRHNDASYYFSRYPHIWGWASWRRAWQHYDVNIRLWVSAKDKSIFLRQFESRNERRFWKTMWNKVPAGKIDTWDFQWAFACMIRNGLAVNPSVNLVSNIGYGVDSVHTKRESPVANLPTEEIQFPLRHPESFTRNIVADEYTGRTFFTMPGIAKQVFRKVKRIISSKLVSKN